MHKTQIAHDGMLNPLSARRDTQELDRVVGARLRVCGRAGWRAEGTPQFVADGEACGGGVLDCGQAGFVECAVGGDEWLLWHWWAVVVGAGVGVGVGEGGASDGVCAMGWWLGLCNPVNFVAKQYWM